MPFIYASRSRPVIARIPAPHDDQGADRPAPVCVLLGCLVLLLWGYLTYVDWPIAWPAPIRPIVKALGWLWMIID